MPENGAKTSVVSIFVEMRTRSRQSSDDTKESFLLVTVARHQLMSVLVAAANVESMRPAWIVWLIGQGEKVPYNPPRVNGVLTARKGSVYPSVMSVRRFPNPNVARRSQLLSCMQRISVRRGVASPPNARNAETKGGVCGRDKLFAQES